MLALDVVYERDANTHVHGLEMPPEVLGLPPTPVDLNSGPGHSWTLAPAIEFNFNSHVGVIAGVQLTLAGQNATALIIPTAAVNIVL